MKANKKFRRLNFPLKVPNKLFKANDQYWTEKIRKHPALISLQRSPIYIFIFLYVLEEKKDFLFEGCDSHQLPISFSFLSFRSFRIILLFYSLQFFELKAQSRLRDKWNCVNILKGEMCWLSFSRCRLIVSNLTCLCVRKKTMTTKGLIIIWRNAKNGDIHKE